MTHQSSLRSQNCPVNREFCRNPGISARQLLAKGKITPVQLTDNGLVNETAPEMDRCSDYAVVVLDRHAHNEYCVRAWQVKTPWEFSYWAKKCNKAFQKSGRALFVFFKVKYVPELPNGGEFCVEFSFDDLGEFGELLVKHKHITRNQLSIPIMGAMLPQPRDRGVEQTETAELIPAFA